MENMELNKQEKKELEKRGFYVKEVTNGWNFMLNIVLSILLFSLAFTILIFPAFILGMLLTLPYGFIGAYLGFFYEIDPDITSIYFASGILGIFTIIYIISLFRYIWNFSIAERVFFLYDQILWCGKIKERNSFSNKYLLKIDFFKGLLTKLVNHTNKESGDMDIITKILSIIVFSLIFGTTFLFILGIIFFVLHKILYLALLFYIVILISFWILPFLIRSFIPTYQYGYVGIKIQKLTPQIEEQSQKIQSEFEKDMNFSILHSGFEKLSSTFSEIVSLVIRLEKVETRANKGNLFDSEKYINSLRSDIVTPLSSLQIFLENQKIELEKSQKELSRVRVGGSEESGNTELASKRSESLIAELDMNIGALSEMIGKMENT